MPADNGPAAEATGGTRWRRFFLALGAGVLAVALMFAGLQQGLMAASFTVAGVPYKASADHLNGQGVVQFGGVDQGANALHPVFINGFKQAELTNFCQSIAVGGIPILGGITIRIDAPGGATAQNLVIDIQDITGNSLTLNNVEIGRDAGTLDRGPVQGPAGSFGIQADSLAVEHLHQIAWATTASTLTLNQVHIKAEAGFDECF